MIYEPTAFRKGRHLLLGFLLLGSGLHAQLTFRNDTPIDILDGDQAPISASPYPSAITVSGVEGSVRGLSLILHGFSHSLPDAVDILLVGPDGTNAVVMSDVGGAFDVNGLELTLTDSALAPLPDADPLQSGSYNMSNQGGGDTWAAPSPAASGFTSFSAFNGTGPNGTWQLYVVSDVDGSFGRIDGGWTLRFYNEDITLPAAVSGLRGRYQADRRSVVLEWRSLQAVDHASWTVERSADGRRWQQLAAVRPQRGTGAFMDGRYEDAASGGGLRYYRLRQERGGRFFYSEVLPVSLPRNPAAPAPRPEQGGQPAGPPAPTQLLDMHGRLLLQRPAGQALSRSELRGLAPGVYLLRSSAGGRPFTRKLWVGN